MAARPGNLAVAAQLARKYRESSRSLINQHVAFSGSWITALPIAAKRRSIVFALNGPTCSSCAPLSTQVGSLKLRFTSPLCRGRFSHPMTSNPSTNSNNDLAFQQRHEDTASPFQWTFTRKDLTTHLLAKIENKRFPPQPDPKIRNRNSEREHLAKSPAFSSPCFATLVELVQVELQILRHRRFLEAGGTKDGGQLFMRWF